MKRLTLLFAFLLLYACRPKTHEIIYGKDICEYCSMAIIDKAHVAQLVTMKGKNYKFDSIECMIHFMKKNSDHSYVFLLVADYNHPGELISIRNAWFIISKNIPSPMNAHLSAVSSRQEAYDIIKKQTGQIYKWNEILTTIKDI